MHVFLWWLTTGHYTVYTNFAFFFAYKEFVMNWIMICYSSIYLRMKFELVLAGDHEFQFIMIVYSPL